MLSGLRTTLSRLSYQVLVSAKGGQGPSLLFPFKKCCSYGNFIASSRATPARNMSTLPLFHSSVSSILAVKHFPAMQSTHQNLFPSCPSKIQCRGIVKCSKRGKRKTVKAVAKRFYRTGSGKLKYWPAGHVHNMLSKSFNKRRNLRKPRYASKIQMKTLNKMIAGW